MDILQVLQRPFPGDLIQGNWDCSLARPGLMAYSAALKEGAASLPDSVNHCVVQLLTTCLGGVAFQLWPPSWGPVDCYNTSLLCT